MRIAIAIGLALIGLAFPISSADAYVLSPQVDAEFSKIVEFNYRGSAQASPPTCGPVCRDLRAAEARPGGWSTPTVEKLSREARTLRVATGLSSAIRLTGGVTLAAASFDIGYRIGSGFNAKFFKVGMPAKSPVQTNAPQKLADWSSCSPTNPCSIGNVETATVTQPTYVWTWDAAWNTPYGANYWSWRSNDIDCSHPAPPAGAPNVFETAGAWNGCSTANNVGTNSSAWWYPNEFRAASPVQDYTDQPYTYQDWPPGDPGVTTVATRTRTELESDNYPTLNRQLEFELGVPGVCDPVEPAICNPPQTDRDRERLCEKSPPENADPNPGRTTERFAPALYEGVTPFTRTTTTGAQVSTALKVGSTWPHTKKLWAGWGWRHVVAKHGWSTTDISETQSALLRSPEALQGKVVSFRYRGEEYRQNGAVCERVVIVAPNRQDDLEPEPKEIVTSYGNYVGADQ